MIFSSLRTTSFRNLHNSEIFTGSKDVYLIGKNGQGKTNFLEALYFCAYGSSFRTVRDSEIACNSININSEKSFSASVKTSANTNVLVKFKKNKKTVLIDGKRIEDRKDLLSITPCIIFCHEDMEFVSGTPERRRWFFDQVLSLYDPVYLEDLRCYKRVLKSRNIVLRDYAQHKYEGNVETVLDALDLQCVMYGVKLMEKRETAVQLFSGILGPLYEEVSGIKGISVKYIKSWKNADNAVSLLSEKRAADKASGLTLSGPHRDRYVFSQNSFFEDVDVSTDFTVNASTGQRRLLALLLRTAQSIRYSQMTGKSPVLLLDDVLLEMDGEKRRMFLSVLPGYDQAFFTFLPEEPYNQYRNKDTLIYNVSEGKLIPA
jgi:DNA replication and repair protein RecF